MSMRAKQSLGQNFLMHQKTADRIADAGALTARDTVFEIGPGTGMLTRALLERAGKVIALEADHELIPVLMGQFAPEIKAKKLKLIEGDIRTFDLGTLPKGYGVVANIPYYVTGEIIRKLLSSKQKPSRVVLLVQKEVAVRVVRSKKESLLSLSVKIYGTARYCFTVPRGAFKPAPKVDSAVLAISDIKAPFSTLKTEDAFFAILHAGFGHKRKRLAKNLEEVASKEKIAKAFTTLSLGENSRAEDMPLATWKSLVEALS